MPLMSSPHERPARFDVGIVGAGRVGAVLGAALTRAGHHVTGVSAVSEASRAFTGKSPLNTSSGGGSASTNTG